MASSPEETKPCQQFPATNLALSAAKSTAPNTNARSAARCFARNVVVDPVQAAEARKNPPTGDAAIKQADER